MRPVLTFLERWTQLKGYNSRICTYISHCKILKGCLRDKHFISKFLSCFYVKFNDMYGYFNHFHVKMAAILDL